MIALADICADLDDILVDPVHAQVALGDRDEFGACGVVVGAIDYDQDQYQDLRERFSALGIYVPRCRTSRGS